MQPTTGGCKTSTFDFAPRPSDEDIRSVVLALARLTRWSRESILNLTYEEALWWLEGATELEKEINR